MITALRIRNFKSLADTGTLAVRPLTFLVGPNSAGKTSIVQSLLLLRQTVESRDLKNPLSINGPYVQLGSYPDLLFMHDYKTRLQFELDFNSRPGRFLPALFPNKGLSEYPLVDVHFEVEFGYNKKTMQVFLQRCSFEFLPTGIKMEIARTPGAKYQASVYPGEGGANEVKVIPVSGVEKFYAARRFEYKSRLTVATRRFRSDLEFLGKRLAREIEQLFGNVFYIGPLREWPKRIYIATGEAPADVGLKGELSVDVLWVQARTKRTRERLLGRVNHWMREFEIGSEVTLRRIGGNNYSVMFKDPKTGLDVNLADVGFGASQVFPIVVEGFYAGDQAMLLIEQPEIHLHPRAQGTLGDLLIDIATSGGGKNLLVETHSEHVLGRIRRRIAEKKLRGEDVAIYYCKPSAKGTVISQIGINERGQYEGEGLPPGFFEEGYIETVEQFKALAEQRR